MPTRPATWRREKAGSFSDLAVRLARKVSPKERSTLMVWRAYYTDAAWRQAAKPAIALRELRSCALA